MRAIGPHLFLALIISLPLLAAASDPWALIVSSSRFWLNYRHGTNALAVYDELKRLGIPDSRVVVMLADCSACDPRNPFPGQVVSLHGTKNVYPVGAEIDYRGRDVSVEAVLQVLTGHHPPGTPPSRRMDSTRNSSVLVFLTGHGGDGFLKFHDQSELLATDLANAIKSMHAAGRYKELLLVLDTCQAATLYGDLAEVPGWAGIASSKLGQSSYALRSDPGIGTHLIDEFSDHWARYLGRLPKGGGEESLADMLRALRGRHKSSEIAVDASRLGRRLEEVRVADFFAMGGGTDGGAKPREGGERGGGDAQKRANGELYTAAGLERVEEQQGAQRTRIQEEERVAAATEFASLHDLLINAWS